MGKRLENICESLVTLFQKDKRIDEEQVYTFFEGAVDYLDGDTSGNKTAGLDNLAACVQRKWQYREIEKMSPEQVFLCGSIWGGTRLLGVKRERKEKLFEIDRLKNQYSGQYELFHAIAVNPGIRHKELAGRCGKSISSLSQFAVGAMREGLIECSRVGREKYYYLRPLGEQVYEKLKKERLVGQRTAKRLQEMTYRQRNTLMREWGDIAYDGMYNAKDYIYGGTKGNSNFVVTTRMKKMPLEVNNESTVGV